MKAKRSRWRFSSSRDNFFLLPTIVVEVEHSTESADSWYTVHFIWLNLGASCFYQVIHDTEKNKQWQNEFSGQAPAKEPAADIPVKTESLPVRLKIRGLQQWITWNSFLKRYVTTEDVTCALIFEKQAAEALQAIMEQDSPQIFTVVEAVTTQDDLIV